MSFLTLIPIASADISLSLTALIILPQGDLIAFCKRKKIINKTNIKSIEYKPFTIKEDNSITDKFRCYLMFE